MITIQTERPRELNSWRAAGILYGDLGTSKAYVLGLAFALAGYSSFWFILAVSILTFLIGLNYLQICKLYPNGGGVYTSARSRSKVLALIGGFFLISDYLVTAAISAVSAFHYLGVENPEWWAIISITAIGLFNLVGPKHTGSLAIALALPTVVCMLCLAAISLPFLPKAVHNLTPISYTLRADWNVFVGIIVALSGIESIANITGSMKLDPGSTCVSKTSTPAILMVIIEVCVMTALLGLAMNALPGLEIADGDVNAPGYPNVRDAMLRYMADIFGGSIFSWMVTFVIMLLLLSSVNTALIALVSLLFVMSQDGEMPSNFQKLNRFGVPSYPTLLGLALPILLLLTMSDIMGLASLYAIGFVGAIAVNLGATSTNPAISLNLGSRIFMFMTFLLMTSIEITLFIDKPHARIFVLSILGFGFFMRALVAERMEKAGVATTTPTLPKIPENPKESSLIAVTGLNKSLDFALNEAKKSGLPLYILFIREQRFVTSTDQSRLWTDDSEASKVFDHVLSLKPEVPIEFLYNVTSHSAHSIVQIAQLKKVNKVIIGRKRRSSLVRFLRGSTVADLTKLMPKNIDLLVVY